MWKRAKQYTSISHCTRSSTSGIAVQRAGGDRERILRFTCGEWKENIRLGRGAPEKNVAKDEEGGSCRELLDVWRLQN